jgi:hypothetical protein
MLQEFGMAVTMADELVQQSFLSAGGSRFGDYPYLTAEGAVLHCALDASKERREKRKKPFSAFSACSAVKGNGVEKPAFELVGNHQ